MINKPVESKTDNTYSFEINAEAISSYYISSIPVLKKLTLKLSLSNYAAGIVNIRLQKAAAGIIYNKFYKENINNFSVNLDNISPDTIQLEFENFSGEFSIMLTGSQ
jgi:hypothetical protein